jgi:hypothetical protein
MILLGVQESKSGNRMALQTDLVRIKVALRPLAVIKG